MIGHDTVVYVIDEKGSILFIKTFDIKTGGETERLAAIDCFTEVNDHFGYGIISSVKNVIINSDEPA